MRFLSEISSISSSELVGIAVLVAIGFASSGSRCAVCQRDLQGPRSIFVPIHVFLRNAVVLAIGSVGALAEHIFRRLGDHWRGRFGTSGEVEGGQGEPVHGRLLRTGN